MAKPPPEAAWPTGRYKLTEDAYIGRAPGAHHERLGPGTEIIYCGRPGPHMEPLDGPAREAVDRSDGIGEQHLDPAQHLSLASPDPMAVPPGQPLHPHAVQVGSTQPQSTQPAPVSQPSGEPPQPPDAVPHGLPFDAGRPPGAVPGPRNVDGTPVVKPAAPPPPAPDAAKPSDADYI